MTRKPCDHTNLVKIEQDSEKGHSIFKCSDCGMLTSMDKHFCKLCGDLPVDDISEHMLQVHNFDVNRWDAVTGLGT